jgi:hypothetical protein
VWFRTVETLNILFETDTVVCGVTDDQAVNQSPLVDLRVAAGGCLRGAAGAGDAIAG